MAKKEIRKCDIEKDEKAIMSGRKRRTAGKIIATVVVLMLIGTIVGINVGIYKVAEGVWNENIGNEAGVPFKDVFTIFKGVKKADENDIVTNAYGDDDLTAFYSNIKRKMFLDENFNLDVTKILGKVMGGESQTEVEDGEVRMSSQNTGNSSFDDLLKEMKFDFSSLEGYDGSKNILEIPDKQLAAFINAALNGLADVIPSMSDLETMLGCSLNEALGIKQIIISGEINKPESVGLKITLNVKLKKLVSGIVDANDLPAFIKNLMPENIYASIIAYPYDRTRGIQASINKMSEVNVDKVIRIADVVLKKTGSNTSLSQMLVDVNSKFVDVIEKAQEIIPLSFVNSGSMELYPIETLMKMMKIEVSEQAFLTMIRDIKLPSAQSLGFDVYTDEIKQRDTRAFIGEMSAKYGIDNSDNKIGEENTISDVMNFAQGENILNSVNLKSINYDGDYVEKNVRVGASYQALSNMLSSYVNSQEMMGTIKAKIVNMSSNKSGELSLDIEVDVAQMLGLNGDDTMSQLIRQLIPQSIFATATISLDNSQPTSVEINKVGVDNSQKHLQTLTSIATTFGMNVDSLGYDSICSQVDSGIKQGLAKVKEQIGYEITFDTDKAYLPSLYEVVSASSVINGNLEEGDHYFTPQEIRKMLKYLYTYKFDKNFTPTENMDGFIEQLYEKYFVSDDYRTELQEASANNNFLQAMTNIGGDNFMDKIRLEDKEESGKIIPGLKSRLNIIEKSGVSDEDLQRKIKDKFNPMFSLEETAYLIGTQVNFAQTLTFMTDVQVAYANVHTSNHSTSNEDLEIIVKGKGAINNANATSLLPEFIYISIKIDLGHVENGERSDMQVFEMNVNALGYDRELGEKDKNTIQDLQLLLMLIDRVNGNATTTPANPDPDPSDEPIESQPEPQPEPTPANTTSLENIISNIEEKLNGKKNEEGEIVETGFKDRIHNNVFTVTFVDNKGCMLNQTVYDIALNSIYNEDARIHYPDSDKPSEIDFRNAVCKINNMPKNIESKGRTLSLENGNKKDAKNAVDEINEKYALKSKIDSDKLDAVLERIGDKMQNYSTAIDGEKLTSDYEEGTSYAPDRKKTLSNLRPAIEEGELLNLLESSVTITAQGYEDTQMFGLYIVDSHEMTIIYKSKVIKTSDSRYASLLPVDVAMIVATDMDLIDSEQICTSIVFNDLSGDEAAAIDIVRNKINPSGEGTPSGATNLKDANESCSNSVKNSMKHLTDNMNLQFSYNGGKGVMIMDSIYEIASEKVNATNPENTITAQGLKDTLEALFAGLDLKGYTDGVDDIDITSTMNESQELAYNVFASISGVVRGTIGDGNIASKIDIGDLKSNLGMSDSSKADALVLSQSALIGKSDNSLGELRNSLSGRLPLGKDYLLLTLSAEMQSAIGSSLSILPDTMYISVIMDIDDSNGGTQIVYNNLTDEQMSTLSSLMNANADGASGFTKSGNLDNVRKQLTDTVIINNPVPGGQDVTLGMLLEAKKSAGSDRVDVISKSSANKNPGVVEGVGALDFAINL